MNLPPRRRRHRDDRDSFTKRSLQTPSTGSDSLGAWPYLSTTPHFPIAALSLLNPRSIQLCSSNDDSCRLTYPTASFAEYTGQSRKHCNMSSPYEQALRKIDQAHSEDLTSAMINNIPIPYELHYAQKMSSYLEKRMPDASEPLKLAVRAQHFRRWEVPRSSYPMTKVTMHSLRGAGLAR